MDGDSQRVESMQYSGLVTLSDVYGFPIYWPLNTHWMLQYMWSELTLYQRGVWGVRTHTWSLSPFP